jgi:hypothetical protein
VSNNDRSQLMNQTRWRQVFALLFDLIFLVFFFRIADRVELIDRSAAPIIIMIVFVIKVWLRFLTEKGIVSQYSLYHALRCSSDDTTGIESNTSSIIRNFAFEVSFVMGSVLLYLTTIMIFRWVTAIGICHQILLAKLLRQSALLCVTVWLLFEIPSRSMPHLMPWFRTSRLIVFYRVFFGLDITRPKSTQKMYRSRLWVLLLIVPASITALCLLLRGTCASVLVPFTVAMSLGLVLFRVDAIGGVLNLLHKRGTNY